eukprot:m.43158 g.43158  ORF g.43158 m.43158 type:complete len:83 (-) comp15045_c0_seq1:4-252(-)
MLSTSLCRSPSTRNEVGSDAPIKPDSCQNTHPTVTHRMASVNGCCNDTTTAETQAGHIAGTVCHGNCAHNLSNYTIIVDIVA